MTSTTPPLRIGNMSASRADRDSAMTELLDAGAMDVLALDMLSDEAVLQLAADRAAGRPGYEPALSAQLAGCLGRLGPDGVRVVTNAGALDPAGLADRVRTLSTEAGHPLRVAWVDAGVLEAGRAAGRPVVAGRQVDVAIVRHGAGGVAAALAGGADVVITGRVSREALVLGAAMAHHRWSSADLDALAGAVAVGHVLSGGPGATGVSDSSTDVTRTVDPVTGGYPVAEIAGDGTCVITKHPSALGSVTVGTVTDQLLDGVAGPRYVAPDVVLRMDSLRVEQEGTDRVRMSGARGEMPTPELPVVGLLATEAGVRRVSGTVPRERIVHRVVPATGSPVDIAGPAEVAPLRRDTPQASGASDGGGPGGAPRRAPLGTVAGVRGGILDEGVNVAVWAWDDGAYAWLRSAITPEVLADLVPEFSHTRLSRYELPNLRAINFVVDEPTERTVSDWVRGYRRLATTTVDIPSELLEVDP